MLPYAIELDGQFAGQLTVGTEWIDEPNIQNLIKAFQDPRVQEYLSTDPEVQGVLLPLDASFGMHPAMAPLQPFYDDGSLGIVQAVGTAGKVTEISQTYETSFDEAAWRRVLTDPRYAMVDLYYGATGGPPGALVEVGPEPEPENRRITIRELHGGGG